MESTLGELEGSEGEVEMTAAEVLQQLEQAWLNEKMCPDLLDIKSEVVECILDQIKEMEENLKHAKRGDFKVSVHNMEIDRIRFILSSYLRIRLQKIERYADHLLELEKQRSSDDPPRLSPIELNYAQEFSTNMESHFKSLGLRHMPPNLQSLDPKKTVVKPNVDSYVFLRVKEDTEGVLVEEETAESREEVVDLESGDQHIMRYKPVSTLVASSAVILI